MFRREMVKKFRDHLMGYLHGTDLNYEPALRFLMNHEHEVYEELVANNGSFHRGDRNAEAWKTVFQELTAALSPIQIQQLLTRLSRDFMKTNIMIEEMAESQKILELKTGGG
ncbi:MAG: hypothetical protein O2807_06270 [bacterium]|nr:hypothetical protein [bacterium]